MGEIGSYTILKYICFFCSTEITIKIIEWITGGPDKTIFARIFHFKTQTLVWIIVLLLYILLNKIGVM